MIDEDLTPLRAFEVALGRLSRAELLSTAVGYAASADYLRKELDRMRAAQLPPDFEVIDKAISRMVLETAAKQRAESAELIRGELVCCDIHQRLEELLTEDAKPTDAWRALRHSTEYHNICFFGEWAARIVEKGPRE